MHRRKWANQLMWTVFYLSCHCELSLISVDCLNQHTVDGDVCLVCVIHLWESPKKEYSTGPLYQKHREQILIFPSVSIKWWLSYIHAILRPCYISEENIFPVFIPTVRRNIHKNRPHYMFLWNRKIRIRNVMKLLKCHFENKKIIISYFIW